MEQKRISVSQDELTGMQDELIGMQVECAWAGGYGLVSRPGTSSREEREIMS